MKKIQWIAALAAGAMLSACGGGGGAATSDSGTLSVHLTDNPSCGLDHVYVTVKQVRVNASASAGDNDAGWFSVNLATPKRVDLLSLTNGVLEDLGQTPLPAGHYDQVRLVLDNSSALSNTVVPTGGTEQVLSTPSATQSGYKVVGSFDVKAGTLVDLVLDFDACHSIVQKGNGTYSLKPVVTATPEVVSGSISGFVTTTEAAAGATVYAEQGGKIVKGTKAAADGSFSLSPLVQSSTSGNYEVVVAAPGYATAVIKSVPVVASSNVIVATQTAPVTTTTAANHNVSGTAAPAANLITLNATQASGGTSYTVNTTNANLDTGAYSLSLSAGAPYVGTYSSTLPVALTADTSVSGQYQIVPVNTTTGATQAGVAVNVSAADATGINFNF